MPTNDVRALLRGVLAEESQRRVPRSFDIIGNKQKAVAVVEIPAELRGLEHVVADAIMRAHGNVKSVLAKESERTGDFRTRELRLISGDPDTEVIHRESGFLLRLDPRKVYFSPRESAERERISSEVGEHESVLVMFSGIGPLPICIAKRRPQAMVTAIELNPVAHNYCVENINLNKVADRVTPILGDVREVCPTLGTIFDRVIMPLPKGAYLFLDVAVPLTKEGGVLHFYHWAKEPDIFSQAENLIEAAAKILGRRTEILEKRRISQYSPRVWKIRVDARIH